MMSNKLWSDLTTNEERSAWLLSGRGYETGVVAASLQNELSMAYAKLARYEAEQPVEQPNPLSEIQRLDIVTNWFSDGADIARAMQMLTDFEQTSNAEQAIRSKQA